MQLNLQAIMVTAYGTIETAVEVLRAGAMDYITKPIDLEQLLLLIGKAATTRPEQLNSLAQ